jgi:uncharacterized membrane protein
VGVKHVAARKATVDRLSSFSDNVFSVIITIMVLELNPQPHPTFAALLPLWPTGVSYVVSYLFIAIVWVNHHHLLQYAQAPTHRLIGRNFAHLFSVSLVPFSTAWMARTRLAGVPVASEVVVFVLVNMTYVALVRETFERADESEISAQARRMMRLRSFFTLGGLHDRDGGIGQISPVRPGAGLLLFALLSAAGASAGCR